MTTSELAFLDTNILIYAYYPESPQHQSSYHLLNEAQDEGARLCISPQILAEFYSVVTNPRRVDPALEPEAAIEKIGELKELVGLTILSLPVDVVDRWIVLLRQHPARGQKIFDLQIVATMLGNGVKKIYTFNVKDFEHFSGLEIVEPANR